MGSLDFHFQHALRRKHNSPQLGEYKRRLNRKPGLPTQSGNKEAPLKLPGWYQRRPSGESGLSPNFGNNEPLHQCGVSTSWEVVMRKSNHFKPGGYHWSPKWELESPPQARITKLFHTWMPVKAKWKTWSSTPPGSKKGACPLSPLEHYQIKPYETEGLNRIYGLRKQHPNF